MACHAIGRFARILDSNEGMNNRATTNRDGAYTTNDQIAVFSPTGTDFYAASVIATTPGLLVADDDCHHFCQSEYCGLGRQNNSTPDKATNTHRYHISILQYVHITFRPILFETLLAHGHSTTTSYSTRIIL
jgi:hypothetical protein